MERKKENQRCSFQNHPPPLRICTSNPRLRGRLRLGGGRPALGGARTGSTPGDRRGVSRIRPPWVWRSGWKWAVAMKCNQDRQLLLYRWWPHRAEGLQSPGAAFISAETGGGRPLPRQWLESSLPVRWSHGFFVNSHASFCCGYKDSVFIRCCDLRYTNPLKKTQMKSPAGKVKSNEVGCCEEW